MDKGKGRLFVISAPSGGGKGTIIERILSVRPGLAFSVSATTRAPRAGEVDGVSYHFVERARFLEMIDNDEFLEHAQYVGEYYGTPAQPILDCIDGGRDILLDIEVQGARQVVSKMPDAVTIFIVPPSMEELERRLRGRGTDSGEKLLARLERARAELEQKDFYKYIVVNDVIERSAEEILQIIG